MSTSGAETVFRRHIARIGHIEECSRHSLEGECTLWDCSSCTIVIDCAEAADIAAALDAVAAHLDWLDSRQTAVADLLAQHTGKPAGGMEPVYIGFLAEEGGICADFAVTAAAIPDQLAEFALEADGSLIFGGFQAA